MGFGSGNAKLRLEEEMFETLLGITAVPGGAQHKAELQICGRHIGVLENMVKYESALTFFIFSTN